MSDAHTQGGRAARPADAASTGRTRPGPQKQPARAEAHAEEPTAEARDKADQATTEQSRSASARSQRQAPPRRQATRARHSVFDRFSLGTVFTMFGFAVSIVMLFMFGVDLLIGWPFQHASMWMDIGGCICALGVAYLSWNAYRDLG